MVFEDVGSGDFTGINNDYVFVSIYSTYLWYDDVDGPLSVVWKGLSFWVKRSLSRFKCDWSLSPLSEKDDFGEIFQTFSTDKVV